MNKNILELLEELRAIGQTGLNFSKDEYDIKRYKRLLELASEQYSDISGMDKVAINQAFLNDLAYATPKVGAEGAVFKDGNILLVKRSDNNKWCLPCGWCEITESPREAVTREVWEETGLTVSANSLIDIFNVLSSEYEQPHSYYQILFHCEYLSGELTTSDETTAVGFFALDEIKNWHRNHDKIAKRAMEYYKNLK